MMNQNQSNEDALQKAIDDITKNAFNETAAMPNEADVNSAVAAPDLTMPETPVAEAAPVAEETTTPTMPEMPAVGPITDIPAAPEVPSVPEVEVSNATEPEIPSLPETPVAETAPVAEETTEIVTEEQPIEQNQTPDSNNIKERALRDLAPILDKVELEPEKKFQIYIEIINTLGDQSIYEDAYNTATEISDEKSRGEALFKLIESME